MEDSESLSKLIFNLYSDEQLFQRYKSSRESVLNGFDLSPKARRAVLEGDYAFMYCSGVHPALIDHMLQIDFSDRFGMAHDHYLKLAVPKMINCPNSYQDYYKQQQQ